MLYGIGGGQKRMQIAVISSDPKYSTAHPTESTIQRNHLWPFGLSLSIRLIQAHLRRLRCWCNIADV